MVTEKCCKSSTSLLHSRTWELQIFIKQTHGLGRIANNFTFTRSMLNSAITIDHYSKQQQKKSTGGLTDIYLIFRHTRLGIYQLSFKGHLAKTVNGHLQSWTKVLGHLRSWGVFQFTQVQPLHSPHKQCWTRVSRIFSEFQLCIGWREGEMQENFENDALF